MDLVNTMKISAAGMKAQGERLRIVSQNIANAESTGTRPGEAPYRRQTISFRNVLDHQTGMQTVQASDPDTDPSAFPIKYDPTHPAADENGYVQMPNVNSIMEMMDMREARRSYEANLSVVEVSKAMLEQTIALLRN